MSKKSLINKTWLQQNQSLLMIVAFFVAALLLFPWFTIPRADDFARMLRSEKMGLWNYMWHTYTHFEGRFLALYDIIKNYMFYYIHDVRIINFVWTIVLFLTGWFFAKYLNAVAQKPLGKPWLLLLAAFWAVVIWLAQYPILHEVYYWATSGSSYALTLMSIAIWVYYLEQVKKWRTFKYKILIFLISVTIGNAMYYISVPMLIYLGFWLLEIKADKHLRRDFWLFLFNALWLLVLPLVIGNAYTAFAPGTKIRMQRAGVGFDLSIGNIIFNAIALSDEFLHAFARFIVLSSLLGFLILKAIGLELSRRKALYLALKWFVISWLSLLAFTPLTLSWQVLRVGYLFASGLTMALSLLLYAAFNFNLVTKRQIVLSAIGLLFVVITGRNLINQIRFYREEYLPRLTRVLEHRFHSVELCPYTDKLAPFYSETLRHDPKYWGNQIFAGYYGLKSVKLKDCLCPRPKYYPPVNSSFFNRWKKSLSKIKQLDK